MALTKATQSEVAEDLADATGFSRADAKKFLGALEQVVIENLANCIRTPVAGVVIEPKLRAKTKARAGRNPATGEDITIAAKPASVVVKARVTKKLKDQAPSVKKLSGKL